MLYCLVFLKNNQRWNKSGYLFIPDEARRRRLWGVDTVVSICMCLRNPIFLFLFLSPLPPPLMETTKKWNQCRMRRGERGPRKKKQNKNRKRHWSNRRQERKKEGKGLPKQKSPSRWMLFPEPYITIFGLPSESALWARTHGPNPRLPWGRSRSLSGQRCVWFSGYIKSRGILWPLATWWQLAGTRDAVCCHRGKRSQLDHMRE